MRNFGYELLKLCKQKTLWALLLALLAVTAYLYGTSEQKNAYLYEDLPVYEQLEAQYKDMQPEDAVADLRRKQDICNVRLSLLHLQQNADEEAGGMTLEWLREEYPELMEEFEGQTETLSGEELSSLYNAYTELFDQFSYIQSYPSLLTGMEENAQKMLKVSIFHEKGSFSYNNILKTPGDFAHLKGIELKPGLSEGVVSSTSFFPADLFLLILVFFLCIFLFIREQEKGLYLLIKPCRNGRGPVIAAKLGVLVAVTLLFTLLFYGLLFAMGNGLYGFGDLSRPIQSMSEFSDCTWKISVFQYLSLTVAIKFAVLATVGVLFSLLFSLLKNSVPVYAACLGLLSAFYLAYQLIPSSFQLNHFKYINPFALFDTYTLLSRYQNLNFFNQPISVKEAGAVFLLILFLAAAVITCVLFIRQRQIASKSRLARWLERLSTLWRKRDKSSHLFPEEGYKIMIQGKAVFLLIAAAFLGVYTMTQGIPVYTDQGTATYRSYMKTMSGEATPEKQVFYEQEEASFQKVMEEIAALQERYEAGEITARQRYEQQMYLQSSSEAKRKGFELLQKDHAYLQKLQTDKGIAGHYVDQITAGAFFDDTRRDIQNGLVLLLFAILCLGNVFAMDYRNRVDRLLRCTTKGQGPLARVKLYWSLILIAFLFCAIDLPAWINVYRAYGPMEWSAPLQSVSLFYDTTLSVTIGQYVILSMLIKFLGLCCAASVILLLCVLTKNYFLTIGFSTGILLLPLFLQSQGIDLRFWSFNNLFLLNNTLCMPDGALQSLIHIGILMVMMVAVLYVAVGCYCGHGKFYWKRRKNRREGSA